MSSILEKNFKNNEIFFTSRNFDIDVREEVIKNLRCVEECKKLGINPILVATQETNKVIINWFENIYKPNKSEKIINYL